MENKINPNIDEKIKQYKSAIKMHTSEGRYQTKPDLNIISENIDNELNKRPSEKYTKSLYELKKQIGNIQKKRS